MTLREFIERLPDDERKAFMQRLHAQAEFNRRALDVGRTQAALEKLPANFFKAFANTGAAVFQFPFVAAGALPGVPTPEFATKPLFGSPDRPGLLTSAPTPADVSPLAPLGEFAGFIGGIATSPGSALVKGGLQKFTGYGARAALAGDKLNRAQRLGKFLAEESLLARAGQGAATLGTDVLLGTPGDLEERSRAGLHAAPAGALFGLAHRLRGIVGPDGKVLTGRALERFLEKEGIASVGEGLERGLILGKEHFARFLAANVGRMGAAGLPLGVTDFSPVEFTGNPYLDSAIFNAGFGFLGAIKGREVRLPFRSQAQVIEARRARQTEAREPIALLPPSSASQPIAQLPKFTRSAVETVLEEGPTRDIRDFRRRRADLALQRPELEQLHVGDLVTVRNSPDLEPSQTVHYLGFDPNTEQAFVRVPNTDRTVGVDMLEIDAQLPTGRTDTRQLSLFPEEPSRGPSGPGEEPPPTPETRSFIGPDDGGPPTLVETRQGQPSTDPVTPGESGRPSQRIERPFGRAFFEQTIEGIDKALNRPEDIFPRSPQELLEAPERADVVIAALEGLQRNDSKRLPLGERRVNLPFVTQVNRLTDRLIDEGRGEGPIRWTPLPSFDQTSGVFGKVLTPGEKSSVGLVLTATDVDTGELRVEVTDPMALGEMYAAAKTFALASNTRLFPDGRQAWRRRIRDNNISQDQAALLETLTAHEIVEIANLEGLPKDFPQELQPNFSTLRTMAREHLLDTVSEDMAGLHRMSLPADPPSVFIGHSKGYAIYDPVFGNLGLGPAYFALPRWARRIALKHEIGHRRTLTTRANDFDWNVLTALYNKAGMPAVRETTLPDTQGAINTLLRRMGVDEPRNDQFQREVDELVRARDEIQRFVYGQLAQRTLLFSGIFDSGLDLFRRSGGWALYSLDRGFLRAFPGEVQRLLDLYGETHPELAYLGARGASRDAVALEADITTHVIGDERSWMPTHPTLDDFLPPGVQSSLDNLVVLAESLLRVAEDVPQGATRFLLTGRDTRGRAAFFIPVNVFDGEATFGSVAGPKARGTYFMTLSRSALDSFDQSAARGASRVASQAGRPLSFPEHALPKINGTYYGWSDPTELLAEGAVLRTFNPDPDLLRDQYGGLGDLLSYAHRDQGFEFVQGITNLRQEADMRNQGMLPIVDEAEILGPPWSVDEAVRFTADVDRNFVGTDPQRAELTQRVFRAELHPFNQYLAHVIGLKFTPEQVPEAFPTVKGETGPARVERWQRFVVARLAIGKVSLLPDGGELNARDTDGRRIGRVKRGGGPGGEPPVALFTKSVGGPEGVQAALSFATQMADNFKGEVTNVKQAENLLAGWIRLYFHKRFKRGGTRVDQMSEGDRDRSFSVEPTFDEENTVDIPDATDGLDSGIGKLWHHADYEATEVNVTDTARTATDARSGTREIFKRDPNMLVILNSKLEQVFSDGEESLRAAVPNPRMREVLLLRFGGRRTSDDTDFLYKNQDGTPLRPQAFTAREIARKLRVSQQHVNGLINDFILNLDVDIQTPTGYLMHPNLLRYEGHKQETFTFQNVESEGPRFTSRIETEFHFRDPKDPSRRLRLRRADADEQFPTVRNLGEAEVEVTGSTPPKQRSISQRVTAKEIKRARAAANVVTFGDAQAIADLFAESLTPKRQDNLRKRLEGQNPDNAVRTLKRMRNVDKAKVEDAIALIQDTATDRNRKIDEAVEEGLLPGDLRTVAEETFKPLYSLPGGQRGIDKRIIAGDTIYRDPVTGDLIGRQTSLDWSRQVIRRRSQAERDAGPERAEDQIVPPPEPTQAENAAQAAVFEPLTGRQLRFGGKGFGQKKRPAGAVGRAQEIDLYYSVSSNLGVDGITERQWDILHPNQQLQHAILRFRAALQSGQRRRYTATIKKYEKFLNKGVRRKPLYPLLRKMAQLTKQPSRVEAFNTAARGLHVEVDTYPLGGGRWGFKITEQDTGKAWFAPDVATASLLLDMRARRLLSAPDLEPPGFDFIRLGFPDSSFGGAGGGPRGPLGPDRALDGESSGVPPDPPRPSTDPNKYKDRWVFLSKVRNMRDLFATISAELGDYDLIRAVDTLINLSQIARSRSLKEISRMWTLAKKHKIDRKRGLALGNAARILDNQGSEILTNTGSIEAGRRWIEEHQRDILRDAGLEPNEVDFLVAMRAEWDRLFGRVFSEHLGPQYVPGYFARWQPNKDFDTGTVFTTERGMKRPSSLQEFFAAIERTQEVSGIATDYFDVFASYARAGHRWKLIGTKTGSAKLTPLEFAEQVGNRYSTTDNKGTRYSPAWMDAYMQVINRARGVPDRGTAAAQSAARGRLRHRRDVLKRVRDSVHSLNAPVLREVVPLMDRHLKELGVRIDRPNLETWADYVIGLNRARTFGLHIMRSVRHLTQSSFFVLPRVGPKYFGMALNDMLGGNFEKTVARAAAAGVVKQAFFEEYSQSRSGLLSKLEKLSFLYSKLDRWERVLSFRSQELKSLNALEDFKSRLASVGFERAWERYSVESGLTMLHPAFRVIPRDYFKRGNYAEGIRQHARILVDHTIFDYTRVNQPYWAGSQWGRLFGQYGRWPLGAVETMYGMYKFGTSGQKIQMYTTYAAVSASVYGLGQFFGVKTGDWIPFIHAVVYGGGPSLSLVDDILDILGGDPLSQDEFLSNWQHDPFYALMSIPAKTFLPLGDIAEAVLAETNLTRRQRRLLGVPRRAQNWHESLVRLMGFRPVTDEPKHHPLLKEAVGAIVKPIGEQIKGAAEHARDSVFKEGEKKKD